MAPADSPGRKKRDNQYFNVGVQGRKTGITLKDTGVRDEHGMEPMDGIFSSPEKSPPKRSSARAQDRTLTSSDMEVQHSSMPEPADALSARKSLRPNRSSIFPPPMSRSPIKTALGSSPRRQSSMGPPLQLHGSSKSPDRAASHPAVVRRLDFSTNDDGSEQTDSGGRRNKGRPRPDVYDLPQSPVRGQKRTYDDSIAEEDEDEETDLPVNGIGDESPLPAEGDDSLQILSELEDDNDDENVEESMEIVEPKPRKGRGKARQSIEKVPEEREEEQAGPAPKQGRGRPKRAQGLVSAKASSAALSRGARGKLASRLATNGDITEDSAMDVDKSVEESSTRQMDEEEPEAESEPVKKKRGRPKATSKLDMHKDEPQESAESSQRPAKRAKKTAAPKKPPPSQRDPTAKIVSKKKNAKDDAKGKKASKETPPPVNRSSMPPPSAPRNTQILRQGTPFDDDGARTTRSGRISTKPLDYWRGERIEYGADRSKLEVIRAEDVEQPKRKVRRRRGGLSARSKRPMSEIEEEPELELEEWEEDPGIIAGWVNGWEEAESSIVDEGGRQEDIAFSATKIQTREVAGANFRYSKILGIPFFGAGMVDIPPLGSKRSKNSRRMHMAFCLLSGKVGVTVGDTEFSINKGGVWLVPRGNFYSITNDADIPARIFFAQGCEVPAEKKAETA